MKIPETPPDILKLVAASSPERLSEVVAAEWGAAPDGKYRHWDTLRRIGPPEGFTPEEYWLGLKLSRRGSRREIPGLRDKNGKPFWFSLVDPVLDKTHAIDQRAAGGIALPGIATGENARRYARSNIVEESITSSQLEGASTTRRVAKEMIYSGRKPRNRSEQMILNNYQAMLGIENMVKSELTVRAIEELHGMLTSGTANEPVSHRQLGDGIAVYDNTSNTLLHDPPAASESRDRLDRLCEFANHTGPSPFVHPVIRAITLHFWLAYIHPFTDGNGRTARALFYWSLMRSGYWLSEYVSISRLLRKAPARYGRSFLYSETDENDLTYFVLHHLDVFLRAIEDFEKHLERKETEHRSLAKALRPGGDFNHRQVALLSHAVKHPGAEYSIEAHRSHHGVVYQTARTDLLSLADAGLLEKHTRGRAFYFNAVIDLPERLKGALRP